MLQIDYIEDGYKISTLSVANEKILFRDMAYVPKTISIVSKKNPIGYQRIAEFIQGVYARSYDAHITVRYPILMAVLNDEDEILGAVGLRFAKKEPLFLEQYLDQPIEDVLESDRSKIAEVGNLASKGGGMSLFLFSALSLYLKNKGKTHAVVTGTRSLERRLKILGLNPKRHAKADDTLLKNNHDEWGSYYQTQPHVLSGSLLHAYKRLTDIMGIEYQPTSYPFVPIYHKKGAAHHVSV